MSNSHKVSVNYNPDWMMQAYGVSDDQIDIFLGLLEEALAVDGYEVQWIECFCDEPEIVLSRHIRLTPQLKESLAHVNKYVLKRVLVRWLSSFNPDVLTITPIEI